MNGRILLCQHGSRRRYKVAKLLHDQGLLAALYTDFTIHTPLGRLLSIAGRIAGKGIIQKLENRDPIGLPKDLVKCSDTLIYADLFRKFGVLKYDNSKYWGELLSKKMIKWFKEEEEIAAVYNMYCENYLFISWLKANSKLKIITDVYIHPLCEQIVENESKRLKIGNQLRWGAPKMDLSKKIRVFDDSDVLLCPSEYVARGVIELDKKYVSKIVISPYGCSTGLENCKSYMSSDSKRILWSGSDWLRKGLPVLAKASEIINDRYDNCDFRVAGLERRGFLQQDMFSTLNFLGRLSKVEMVREFQGCTVFVLPTLSEGMAAVVIEACTYGCPVITTKASGVDGLINGENCLLVEPGNADELARAITMVLERPGLKARLSKGARSLSEGFAEEKWRKRLLDVIGGICEQRAAV